MKNHITCLKTLCWVLSFALYRCIKSRALWQSLCLTLQIKNTKHTVNPLHTNWVFICLYCVFFNMPTTNVRKPIGAPKMRISSCFFQKKHKVFSCSLRPRARSRGPNRPKPTLVMTQLTKTSNPILLNLFKYRSSKTLGIFWGLISSLALSAGELCLKIFPRKYIVFCGPQRVLARL